MTHRLVPRRRLMICGALATVLFGGCQFAYEYELRGVIRDSVDGEPLAGVAVALDAGLLFKDAEPVVTNEHGTFVLTFEVGDGALSSGSMPTWSLTLKKPGFAGQVVDISPAKEPQSPKSANVISVVAYVRPGNQGVQNSVHTSERQ